MEKEFLEKVVELLKGDGFTVLPLEGLLAPLLLPEGETALLSYLPNRYPFYEMVYLVVFGRCVIAGRALGIEVDLEFLKNCLGGCFFFDKFLVSVIAAGFGSMIGGGEALITIAPRL